MLNITIKKIEQQDTQKALSLVWKVFLTYEAPDYTKEGVEEFYKSIHEEEYLSNLTIFGAFYQQKLIGVIATRSDGKHIALFFVDEKYQKQGVGKQLFKTVKSLCTFDTMTVNSSPFAVPIYHKLGFCDTDKEQIVNGLRFTPMELKK